MRLHRLPRVLLLHLCRYEWLLDDGGGGSGGAGGAASSSSSGAAKKLHAHLPFPQQLAMRPGWLSDDCPDRPRGPASGLPRYNLQAVVTHLGKHSHGEFWFSRFARRARPRVRESGPATPHLQNTPIFCSPPSSPVARVSRPLLPIALYPSLRN